MHFSRIVALVLALIAGPALAAPPSYNKDVRPILSDHCFRCHGPDSGNRKAKLRLDDRTVAIEKEAIVPGKVDESAMITRILSTDDDEMMPPPSAHRPLSAKQKETLKAWVAAGAEYQPHWAWIAPKRPAPPNVKDAGWGHSPVDAFVRAELESRDIMPSQEADRRTLLRRLSLDLIGLPPTPAEVDAFVADQDPKAYEKQVDRLLASPRYGERMAAGWLDLVRFADTVGYHGDQNANVFPYRDYVIDSFNNNKPFDVFTREQLAGDLIPNPTTESRVATGFNRLNMMTREGGAPPKEYLTKYAADRVRTVSTAWMGSTMGCCECHDHKFDPFSAKDFYSLAAFFADVKQWGVYMDYTYTPNPDFKGYSNDHPFPPEMSVESSYLKRRTERIRGEMTALADKLPAVSIPSPMGDGWLTPTATFANEKEAGAKIEADGRVLVTRKAKKGDAIKVRLNADPGYYASLRLQLLPEAALQGRFVRAGGSAVILLSATLSRAGKEMPVSFYAADADQKDERYSNGHGILGILGGWKPAAAQLAKPQTGVWLMDPQMEFREGDALTVNVKSDAIGSFRLSLSPFATDDPSKPFDLNDTDKYNRLRSIAANTEAFAKYKRLHRELAECRGGQAQTVVTEAWKPAVTRVLPRGNWQDESGTVVQPAVPHFLPQPAKRDGLTRLDLADWLTAAENPLTARVFVNRLWKQFNGVGLSNVLDDVGAQGEWPTHPELLDWLAVEFRERGWDVKHLVRLIVLSSTYRQDSKGRPALREADPANRLLASHTPRRLEAEQVRDNALAVAGLLDSEIGGPSAKPYQPPGYYANLQFPDRPYRADGGERQYRRGVYTHWQRTFLHPMLANFDAPSRDETCACRTNANTPQQALTLLNDPTFVEAARVLATTLKGDDAARLDQLFRRVLSRPIRPAEAASLATYLLEQRDYFKSRPDEAAKLLRVGDAAPGDGAELAAWASVCRVVLNLHETVTRY